MIRAMPIPMMFVITDLHRGGSPLMLAALVEGLKRRGRILPEVVSIAPLGEVAGEIRRAGITVASLEARGRWDWKVVPRMVRVVQEAQPAVVISILIHANLLTTLARPFVPGRRLWVQSIHTVQERPRWHWYLQGMLVARADGFVGPSRAVAKKLAGFGPLPARDKCAVIANGIDLERFASAQAIAERPWPAGARVAGYVGRFDPVKRLDVLIRAVAIAAKKWPDAGVLLALVGYGAMETSLRRLSAKLGVEDRVYFVGATSEPERWMKSFDIFCHPSEAEGFGLTLLEARAAGLPVIVCATEAVEETLALCEGDVVKRLRPGATAEEWTQVLIEAVVEDRPKKGFERIGGHCAAEWMVERYEAWLLRQLEGCEG